ncbi:hypothetical protein LCGC14_1999280 [marine sediment metagenome]|uniref:Uncharacterized protein n=1 Tax=marine sediment metagenome TaxID=412755 RepID=A0A0F9I0S3_9ZZZZ
MKKKKPTAFENIRLVGVHKEPAFGPLPSKPKCKPSYKQLQDELDKATACEHKNTVHGELKGLTRFEMCLDCGMSRAEDEQATDGWMRNSHACKNVARQWRKLQADLDKALKALRNLHDVQNGPPLLRHEKTWQAAYDEAGNVLEEMEQ